MNSPQDANLLREVEGTVEEARRRARLLISDYWLPNVFFGATALVAAALLEKGLVLAMVVLWTVAGPIGMLLTGLYYVRKERAIGVARTPWPYALTGIGIFVGCMATGFLGRGQLLSYVGPLVVIGLGYLVFAWLERKLGIAVVGALTALLGVSLLLVSRGHAYSLVLAFFGAAALVVGVWNGFQIRRVARP
jgi:hypothetical protein